ncbi:hypothetical protein [Duganella violaceipulchra]|uniref:Uncharacterized protein n=1 Tax=Duganella violaceipulchra TaxID=2849652 RepID=A0AA41L868_9BURK|nr:hypothetical protein [Duganella violaceicalia]MCP2010589.1 hypothetical protein [Duganella violaceicalia]
MPTKYIDDYEVEISAERLEGCKLWGAYVAVFAPSATPMHRLNVRRKHRVAVIQQFEDAASACAAAEVAAQDIVASIKAGPTGRA